MWAQGKAALATMADRSRPILPPAQAQKEAILGQYQSLSQLSPEAAAAIKAMYESAAIQGLIADKEQKLDLDDNAL